jgi:CDP-4-dehydro-6-deoxyglucose reductase
MPRLITLSRAARLVGVKRGALQTRIRAGELRTFEGELLLSDLLHAYPQTQVEDTTMLDRVEQIMEQAVNKVIRPSGDKPDADTLAARILVLGRELAEARRESRRYQQLVDELKEQLVQLDVKGTAREQSFSTLKAWFDDALTSLSDSEDVADDFIAKEAFLRVMAALVHIMPSGHEFFIEGADSILEAGLRSGLALDYGCSNGNCGRCKARVVSGQVKKIRPHDYVLTETEKGLNYILTCSNTAVTDVVLEADEALGVHDIPAQEIDIKLRKVNCPCEKVIILQARTPRTQRLRFLAGQYLSLNVNGMEAQDCSIASCPCDDMNLQFHLPVVPGQPLSDYLTHEMKPNDSMTIKGPRGAFTLSEESPRSLVFLACNNGFGPVKSLIEHAMALDVAEDIHLYWIVADGNRHYLDNLCRSWADALDNFHYTALEADTESAVEGMLPKILEYLGNTDNLDFYVCLPPALVESADSWLRKHVAPSSTVKTEPVR